MHPLLGTLEIQMGSHCFGCAKLNSGTRTGSVIVLLGGVCTICSPVGLQLRRCAVNLNFGRFNTRGVLDRCTGS